MNTCYKCGRELASGAECEPDCASAGAGPAPMMVFSRENFERMHREYLANSVPIDWDKIQTLEDLKLIVRYLGMSGDDRVHKKAPCFEALKRFLKE